MGTVKKLRKNVAVSGVAPQEYIFCTMAGAQPNNVADIMVNIIPFNFIISFPYLYFAYHTITNRKKQQFFIVAILRWIGYHKKKGK